jgi:hypothetical protein
VPEHLQRLYSKHKALYATDVAAGLHNFGEFFKASNSKCMAALLVDVHAANVHAKDSSPIMVEEDVTHNVVNEDAMDIGEVSNKARFEPSLEPAPVPSPEHTRVPSPEHTHVPSPEHSTETSLEPIHEACPMTSRVPSPERTSVPFPEPSCAATPLPSP